MDDRAARARSIQDAIGKILFEDWNPIRVPGGVPRDEYDAYIGGVYRLLSSGAAPEEIAAHLAQIERERMGLSEATASANLTVAKKLSQLYGRLGTEGPNGPGGPEGPEGPETPGSGPKLYSSLSSWWPLLTAPADYAEEAALYQRILISACERSPQTMLELGSGGGNNASHLKAHFQLTLVDRSTGMLEVSRTLNPECQHVQGDMRTVRLGREFDCVFVHDAVCYLTTERDVRQAIETAFVHCRPGGAVLFAPDHVRDNFRPSTDHGGHDGEDRSLRYLEWTWDPDPADSTYLVDFAYLLRDRDGSVRVEWDRHVEGLFARGDWLRWLSEAGFDQPEVHPGDLSDVEPGRYEVFVARRPFSPKP
jgi:SAM-dependent methyltransferase